MHTEQCFRRYSANYFEQWRYFLKFLQRCGRIVNIIMQSVLETSIPSAAIVQIYASWAKKIKGRKYKWHQLYFSSRWVLKGKSWKIIMLFAVVLFCPT